MNFENYKPDCCSRDEIIRLIEYSLQQLSDKELEAVYYDMLTKDYIKS